jgi:three-Cys-motif partner protein
MPKPKPATFFESPQGAAILKHGILRQYLSPFVSKTGSASADHRVVYVDTHAGGGAYDEGTPGSPSLAAVTASKLAHIRNLDCIYVEEDPDQAKRLGEILKGFPCEIINDTIESALDYVLEKAGTSPAFWFVDPFGLAPPFKQVRAIMDRAGKTELLMNVAISAIRRCAGLANPKALNEMMDGDWWQDEVWKKHEGGDTRERDRELVYEYRKRLSAKKYMNWQIPVSDFPGAPPSYYLTFFTQSYDGLWLNSRAGSRKRQSSPGAKSPRKPWPSFAWCAGNPPAPLSQAGPADQAGLCVWPSLSQRAAASRPQLRGSTLDPLQGLRSRPRLTSVEQWPHHSYR